VQPLTIVELNEVNFDFVRAYGQLGELPTLNALIAKHGLTETTSERNYEELEPWIQWVSAHTGKMLADHRVFRLGDIVEHPELKQVWEVIEEMGFTVGAVSPMNARNACKSPAFFLPDPWTQTDVTAPPAIRNLFGAIAQLVSDNASGKAEKSSLTALAAGMARFARPAHYSKYLALASSVRNKPWNKAILLDLLLADLFHNLQGRHQPDFSTVFMNAAAHIQHHYMFNSQVYQGELSNPEWLIRRDHDPIIDVYRLYDDVVAKILAASRHRRVVIATGLHQDPYPETLFYWRLLDHDRFLREIDVAFERVEPRMSRDFVIYCDDLEQAKAAERRLKAARADDGQPLFDVDNRGSSLFVMLTYPRDIAPTAGFSIDNSYFESLRSKCAFVAIKNGGHHGVGYLIDTARHASDMTDRRVPITELFTMALQHFAADRQALVA
jgi:hypothetical protein